MAQGNYAVHCFSFLHVYCFQRARKDPKRCATHVACAGPRKCVARSTTTLRQGRAARRITPRPPINLDFFHYLVTSWHAFGIPLHQSITHSGTIVMCHVMHFLDHPRMPSDLVTLLYDWTVERTNIRYPCLNRIYFTRWYLRDDRCIDDLPNIRLHVTGDGYHIVL